MSLSYWDYYLIQTWLIWIWISKESQQHRLSIYVISLLFAEYLLKIPNLKILRVYSDQIEQKEFPVPNKLKPPRATRSEDELKISSEKIRCVSLHHVIRGPECPFSEELRKYEEEFEQSRAKKENIGQKEVSEYCKVGENMKLLMKP